MDNQEILRKAFRKAKKNGWNSHGYEYIVTSFEKDALPPVMIFDHEFAKAFWPGNQYCVQSGCINLYDSEEGCDCSDSPRHKLSPTFQYHLQEMVLEEDPIKYLEKYV